MYAHLVVGFERFGDDESLHASMSFFNMNKHSRNVDKNGWCDSIQSEVNDWFRAFGLREALGDGEQLPISDSESGPIMPNLGAVYDDVTKWCSGSRSESATVLWSLENAESELFSILLRHDSRLKFEDFVFRFPCNPVGAAVDDEPLSTGR